ncbi:MAG: DUF4476 domain-containing protein [Bdellovibrionota bacterium]
MNKCSRLLVLILAAVLVGCGDKSNNNTDGAVEELRNRIDWNSIPSEYNPSVFEEDFNTQDVNRVFVDMFGFDDDVEVVYTDSLAKDQGYLKIYTVLKGSGSRGSFSSTIEKKNLNLERFGSYRCSIQIKNNKIAELEGLCIVRVQVYLPVGAELEVYNINQLLTRRFIAMDNQTFIKNFKSASFKENKNAVINDYLSSYAAINKRPALLSAELGVVIDGFSFSDKLEALKKLQAYVVDRENIGQMIDSKFSHFDRPEARRICGL